MNVWLDEVPSLDTPNLRDVQQISGDTLNRLAADRKLLTRLVYEILHDPQRLANSRSTLLLNRLSLYQAPERGFEVHLNLNVRPDNQRAAHDHCYTFATRILTGGYVHVVRRRTDTGSGAFSERNLEPGIVTIEHPGSAYTLGHPMVHQAVTEPGTVTLCVRGPRRKVTSNATAELMLPPDAWPAPAEPGAEIAESRPMNEHEYRLTRSWLFLHDLID
ncbi:hypothetical protein [Streptomyces sp. NPDC055060]